MRTAKTEQAAVLLCTTGAPIECFGGACCDVSPDCDQLCGGG